MNSYNILIVSFILKIILLIGVPSLSFGQLSVEKDRTIISNLKTKEDVVQYWDSIYEYDQAVLLTTTNKISYDSIAIKNMIRTALMFKIHGDSSYSFKINNTVPILNLSHSNIAGSDVVFFEIIKKCVAEGGVIQTFGGAYPAYEIECVSMDFYGYSLLGKDSICNELLKKIPLTPLDSIIPRLVIIFNEEKRKSFLKEVSVLGSWLEQPFIDLNDDVCFHFVLMSDSIIYLERNNRLQKLLMISSSEKSTVYKVEGEPFGWSYELFNSGKLHLLNEKNEILINYSSCE